jgi:NAD(P)-dependent dehydrogenase (short-subunit alcohol dehydrogenase family)
MTIVNKLFGLKDRLVIVAGGAGQIGFPVSEILADAGATVVIADIDLELAKGKIAEVADREYSQRLHPVFLDVSDAASIPAFFETVHDRFGELYGLVNSFHYKGNTRKLDTSSNFFAGFEDYPLEAWEKVHDINLRGSFLMSQKAMPWMKRNGGGVVVNFSSTYGNVSANKSIYGASGINSPVAYATSKAAIINLTRYIATHMAEHNIRANVLSPGGVFNNQSEEFLANYTRLTPLNRMAQAGDYQGAVLFLMSDASAYMTGANLVVDGGWTAW